MRIQQWKSIVIILLYFSLPIKAFSNAPLPQTTTIARGGDAAQDDDENQAIDEYIEDLIASVDYSSSESSSEDVRDKVDLQGIVGEGGVGKQKEMETDFDGDMDAQVTEGEDESPITSDSEGRKEDGNPQKGEMKSKMPKKRRKKRASMTETNKDANESPKQGETNQPEDQTSLSQQQQSLGPVRPNALYRFLLNRGRVGHVLVLICVLLVEFIQAYVPPLAYLFGSILAFFSGSSETTDGTNYRRRSSRGATQTVNAQYAAFVSSDGSSVRGKQRKKQARKADEQAAQQLRRVGSIQDAKFRHASIDFMKRHRIGPYRDSENDEELVVYEEQNIAVKTPGGDDDEESDVDWVVEALTTEQDHHAEKKEPTSPIETSFGVDLDNDGATISVGVQFGAPKKKKRRKTLAEAATERPTMPKKKPAGPRTSDRDGGGGVLGRIRAAGANSLVSRSLLGAYPGDAIPPSEAGSAQGVTALAEKYGYGDWSSDDEDEEDVGFGLLRRKVKKRKSVRKQKNSKPSSTGGVNISFGVSTSSSSTRTRTAPTRKRSSSTTRKKKDSFKAPDVQAIKSDILSGKPSNSPPERKRVQVRPPLEKLNAARENAKRRREDED